jgi:4-amino-4-deoxy-L-arabinose transferase-like glycosyltransferase
MIEFKEWFWKNKKTVILLASIILVGIFLRTYKFHDWLRFSHDQARDAWILSSALKGKHSLPLLGPNAGTTAFQLGPVYYYFSYASEKIFGNYPDKMAYPSVLFSILSIPLFFFFMREFFSRKIALTMTAIMSVSYFLVINSRFSSNPNLISFFVLLFLFAFLKILDSKEKRYILWSILAGIGLGVGIQLHTTLLIAMPVVAFSIFAYLYKKKAANIWKSLFIILASFLIINTSQIYHEIKSGGDNSKLFLRGLGSTSGNENIGYGNKLFLITACQMQANTHIISSFQNDDKCSAIFHVPSEKTANKGIYYFGMGATVLFSMLGYFLLWKRFRKEKEAQKKNFLGLVILFNAVSFLILVPIAKIIYVGYFINLFFIPFILLGLMIEILQEKYGKAGNKIAMITVIFLVACSLARDGAKAQSYMKGLENNAENSTLSEVESMTRYIFSNTDGASKIYFSGQDELLGRFYYPVEYFTREAGIKIEKVSQESLGSGKINPGETVYYIEDNNLGRTDPGQTRGGLEIISSKKFVNQTIFVLKH